MRRYMTAANEAFETGNVQGLESLSDTACPCRALSDSIKKTFAAGGHYQGAHYDVRTTRATKVEGRTASVEVSAAVSAYKIIDGTGKTIEDSGGGTLHASYLLVRQEGGSWVITNTVDLR